MIGTTISDCRILKKLGGGIGPTCEELWLPFV
jgi:hypothetical protein